MTKRTYVTATRLTALRNELRPIDWTLVSDVARLNVASGNQLRRLHYADSDTGRRMARLDLLRLVELRLLARLDRVVGGARSGSDGFVYALDVAGQRVLRPDAGRSRKPWTPGNHHLRHALAASELYVRLRELEESGDSELTSFVTEPKSWRSYHGPGGSPMTLKPDAYVVTSTTEYVDSWFIEIDRATEAAPLILDKAKAYLRYWRSGREQAREGVFPSVLFVVPSDKRKQQLVEVLATAPAEGWHLFRIVTAERAASSMLSGELINKQSKEVTS